MPEEAPTSEGYQITEPHPEAAKRVPKHGFVVHESGPFAGLPAVDDVLSQEEREQLGDWLGSTDESPKIGELPSVYTPSPDAPLTIDQLARVAAIKAARDVLASKPMFGGSSITYRARDVLALATFVLTGTDTTQENED